MEHPIKSVVFSIVFATVAVALSPVALHAQTLYQDPTATVWNSSTTNWGAALGGPFATVWTDTNAANFAPSANRTVTLGAGFNPSATGIVLDSTATGNLIIDKDAGGNTITVGASGIANNNATRSLQINPNVTLSANQTWSMATNAAATDIRVDGTLALGSNNLQIDTNLQAFALNGAITGSGNINVNVTGGGGGGSMAGNLSGWTGNLTFDGANSAHDANLSVSSAFNSATTVTVKGRRTLSVTATNLTFTNPFNINGTGIFNFQGAIAKGAGTLELDGALSLEGSLAGLNSGIAATATNSIINVDGGITVGSAGSATFFPMGAGTFNINSPMTNGAGTLAFRNQGGSLVNMNADHSFTGGFQLTTGTVRVTALQNIGVNSQTGNNAAIDFNNSFAAGAVAALIIDGSTSSNRTFNFARNVAGTAAIEVTGSNVVTLSGAMTMSGGATTPLTFEKRGTGQLVLSNPGANTFAGPMVVAAGQLTLNTVLSSSSQVDVRAGAVLSGTGQMNGLVNVLSGGTLAPGNAGATGLLRSGTLSLGSTAVTAIQITGTNPALRGGNFDAIDVLTGGLTYGGNLFFDFSSLATPFGQDTTTTFDIFNFAGSTSGSFATVTGSGGVYGPLSFTNNSGIWTSTIAPHTTIQFSQATGDVQFIVVPEPGSLAICGIGVAVAAWRLRRRRA